MNIIEGLKQYKIIENIREAFQNGILGLVWSVIKAFSPLIIIGAFLHWLKSKT